MGFLFILIFLKSIFVFFKNELFFGKTIFLAAPYLVVLKPFLISRQAVEFYLFPRVI